MVRPSRNRGVVRALLLLTTVPAIGVVGQAPAIPAKFQVALAGIGLNDAIRARGTVALADYLIAHGHLVWPRVGIVTGRAAATRFLRAQPNGKLIIQPLRIVVASDSTLGLEYGVAVWDADSSHRRIGRYVAAWRQQMGAWRLEAFLISNLIEPREVVAVGESRSSADSVRRAVSLGAISAANAAFASDLTVHGTVAFAKWAAPDAVTFGGLGELNTGPAAILTALEPMQAAQWSASTRGASASIDQSTGWSIGELSVRSVRRDGSAQLIRVAYLTLWQRQPSGSMRFIAQASVPIE